MDTFDEILGAKMMNIGPAMECPIKNDGDNGESSVGPNTTLHYWFYSIYKGRSKQNQEEEEGKQGGEYAQTVHQIPTLQPTTLGSPTSSTTSSSFSSFCCRRFEPGFKRTL
jgi:hypothetical protein